MAEGRLYFGKRKKISGPHGICPGHSTGSVRAAPREMTMAPVYITTKEAARHITAKYGVPCSPNWLAKIRSIGGSPPYHPIGRNIYYRVAELDEWFERRVGPRRTSTSDAAACDRRTWEATFASQDEGPEQLDERYTGDPAFDEVTRLEDEAFDLDAAIDAQAKKYRGFNT
jgi:hypothetical protein